MKRQKKLSSKNRGIVKEDIMKANELGTLIRGITSNVNLFISSKIEKYGIKKGQYEYFLLIYSIPGINQLELAKMKNVGKASVTKALKILEDDGFIERIADEKDKRNMLCFVSKKGEEIIHELLDVRTNVEANIFNGFTEEDKNVFFNYLSKLLKNSQKLAAGKELKEGED